MGCDIHAYVEYRAKDNKWHCINHQYPDYSEAGDVKFGKLETNALRLGRDYDMFAQIADVRNESGLAYINEPRDLPQDVSKQVLDLYESWGSDAHSASYVSLRSLVKWYGEHPTLTNRGRFLNAQDIAAFDKDGTLPNMWQRVGTDEPDDKLVRSWEEDNTNIKQLMGAVLHLAFDQFDIFIREYDEKTGLPYLSAESLADERQADKVEQYRVVFWFDS